MPKIWFEFRDYHNKTTESDYLLKLVLDGCGSQQEQILCDKRQSKDQEKESVGTNIKEA